MEGLGRAGPHLWVPPHRVKPPGIPVLGTPAATMTRLPGCAAAAAPWVSGVLGVGRGGRYCPHIIVPWGACYLRKTGASLIRASGYRGLKAIPL